MQNHSEIIFEFGLDHLFRFMTSAICILWLREERMLRQWKGGSRTREMMRVMWVRVDLLHQVWVGVSWSILEICQRYRLGFNPVTPWSTRPTFTGPNLFAKWIFANPSKYFKHINHPLYNVYITHLLSTTSTQHSQLFSTSTCITHHFYKFSATSISYKFSL